MHAVVPAASHGFVSVLEPTAAAVYVQAVDDEVGRWIKRDLFADFYTLGAASYLDAVADLDGYTARAAATNPTLRARFGDLYDAVVAALAPIFGPCALHDSLGYPGFHIFGHRPRATNTLLTIAAMERLTASIHTDRQVEPHHATWSSFAAADLERTMTFTLALELPRRGAGLCFWDDPSAARYGDGDDFAEYVRGSFDFGELLGVEAPAIVPYRLGQLFYFIGQQRHVIAPSWSLSPTDRRITLQGHGVRCDDIWRLYF
jgi:hypothetical protein